MSEKNVKKIIAETFLDIAEGLETGQMTKKPVIGIAWEGSEHGECTLTEGIRMAEEKGCAVRLIDGDDVHEKMEALLADGEIDGAVTMHYPFPIGVSTVGKVVTPAFGREMYISTTTGTSDTDRVCGMVKNAIYGIIAAKACGNAKPTVGIANVDGARQTEKALMALKNKGYDINFAQSARSDGGIVMRGNDLLQGTSDVMVMDPLTGNLMMKMFSSYQTGGGYEATGWGYGPGIGEGHSKLIMIISRASGAPVLAGAVEYATKLVNGKWKEVAEAEFKKAKQCGLQQILEDCKPKTSSETHAQVEKPATEVVTAQVSGIEVMDIEDAVLALWAEKIYAESGMGCTGPIVMVSDDNKDKAEKILTEKGYL